jgi:hypothetical protein
VEYALTTELVEYPLGAGMGRVGMMNAYFGNPMAPPDCSSLYAETQIEAWVIDGGVPLLLGSLAALAVALWSAARIALRGADRELSYWAIVVVVFGAIACLLSLGSMPFLSQIGIQAWVLLGGLFGADALAREEAAGRKPSPRMAAA